MSTIRFFSWLAPRAALVAACAAPAALAAQQQQQQQRLPLFTWSGGGAGRVDVTLRGGSATAVDANGRRVDGDVYVQNAVPRRGGFVKASTSSGAVSAQVIQQPSPANGYTTVVRILRAPLTRDVGVTAYWTADAGTYGDGRGGYGRSGDVYGDDRGRDDRGRYGARDDRDDRRRHGDADDRGRRGSGRGNSRYGGYGDRASYSAGRLRWSGNVDGEVRIRWDGRDAALTRTISGKSATGVGSTVQATAPTRDYGQVVVNVRQGRGQVIVAQQPTARNGYTAVIRVVDPSRGYGHYDFDVIWR
jgi:hypothetical protein